MDNVQVHSDVNSSRLNTPHAAGHIMKKKKSKFRPGLKSLLTAVLLLVIIGSSWIFYSTNIASSLDSNKYQAVFLEDGQVYFGKLKIGSNGYMKLTNVFYLQTKTDNINTEKNDGTNLDLIKLGNEVHGPSDEMMINKDKVLYFENLESNGKVSDAINRYTKK